MVKNSFMSMTKRPRIIAGGTSKAQHNSLISMRKVNAVATRVEAIPFDRDNPINLGIEGDDCDENEGGIRFSVVTYRDPETRRCYELMTTLPKSIRPGTIAILYFKR